MRGMRKLKTVGRDNSNRIGSWGAVAGLTDKQQAEIDTCTHCPLRECIHVDEELERMFCPIEREKRAQQLAAKKRRNMRDVKEFISAWLEATS